MTTIKLKNGSGAPTAGDLVQGEPALDLTNKRLYTEDSGGTVIEVGTNPSTINIDAGTIDGAVIGGSSAAAITGTTITGTSFVSSGNMTFGDNDKAIFGAGSDLQIYHNGSNSFVQDAGAGALVIDSNGTDVRITKSDAEFMAKFVTDGAVELYYDNAKKLATTSTGIDVTGVITTDGMTTSADINFGDNDKAVFGAGSDLQIFHDGSNSYVKENGTGNLWITSNGTSVGFGNNDLSELYAVFNNDGEAKLFFNGVQKFATSSTGIDVTGTVTADGLTVVDTSSGNTTTPAMLQNSGGLGSAVEFRLAPTPYPNEIGSTARWSAIRAINSDVGNATDLAFLTNDISTDPTERMRIDHDGNVGIGISNPSQKLSVAGNIASTGVATPEIELVPTGSVGNADIRFNGTTLDIRSNSASASLLLSTASTERMRIDSGGNAIFTKSNGAYLQLKDASAVRGAINVETSDGLVFTTGASFTERMRIDSSGNVGIGTSSPAAALSLASSTSDSNGIKMQASGWPHYVRSGINGTTGSQFIQSTNWNAATNTVDSSSHAATALILDTSSGSIQFRTETTNTVPTERMRIDSSGRVGIGTSPDFPLHVSSTGVVLGLNATSGAVSQRFNENGTARFFLSTLNGSNGLAFVNGDGVSERMRIDSSGNVGIGVTPTFTPGGSRRLLQVTNGSSGGQIALSNDSNESENPRIFSDADNLGFATATTGGGFMQFYTGGSEAMRIDASGNLLVGQTTQSPHTVGISLNANGNISAKRDGGLVGIFNRGTSDGTIVDFRKDDTSVGSIGVESGDNIYFAGGTGSTKGIYINHVAVYPADTGGATIDNAVDLGQPSLRWKDLYLSGVAYASYVGSSGDTDTSIAFDTANSIRFSTAGSEAARFDSSGNLLVGTTSTTADEGGLALIPQASDVSHMYIGHATGTATGNPYMYFRLGSSNIGSITQSGTTAVLYNTSSDQRLKDNIVDAPSASDDIDAIQVRSFDWKADGSHQKYGMVAQELQSVAPEAVSEGATEEDMMGVDYSKLVPMMMKEIQSLRARVAQLEGEN